MSGATPTLEEFRQLHEAALAFKQQAPWEWMFDDEIFGIRNPETGQIGYASVMGRRGEHLALGLYLGSEGLNGFYRLAAGEEPDNPDILLEIPHLQASFEDRAALSDKDRQVIKTLGLKFRGRQEWPLFRSYVPGFLPWFVTPDEARFLTIALQKVFEVAARLKEDPSLLQPPKKSHFLIHTQTGQGWAEEWLEPEPFQIRMPPRLEEESAAALRQELRSGLPRVEVDLFGIAGIRDKGDPRPYLGYYLMIVESGRGFILGGDLLIADPSFQEMWAKVPVRFLSALTQVGALPSEIWVRNGRLRYFLEPMARQLGIRVKVSRRLPALDEARKPFERRM